MAKQLAHSDAETIHRAGLFYQPFYEHQRSERFGSIDEALTDFLAEGLALGFSPHPLFDVRFYQRRNPDVARTGANPLLHYLAGGWKEGRDPHPLFDNDWYLSQLSATERTNPLVHFLTHGANGGRSPNPLFDGQYYARENEDTVKAGANPLTHYVLYGRDEGRAPSARVQPLLSVWRDPPLSLKRGAWQRQRRLWILQRASNGENGSAAMNMARQLEQHHRLDVRILIDGDAGRLDTASPRTAHLADFGVHTIGNASFRPSALRLLMFALSDKNANIDIWPAQEAPRIVDAFADLGVTVGVGALPATAATTPRRTARERKLVYVPCRDWSLSGVHTVAEELGRELNARGWDFRILFTRGTIGVLDRATEGRKLPSIPYEFLDTSGSHTARQHWAAIIRHLEWRAPCVVLSAFDDFANAVAPALSDDVGVVGWMQSDEDHYYESAYRLGRYWNALACVSRCILDEAGRLNPSFDARSHLIHNSTVRRGDIVAREHPTDQCLRIAYVGRLVQYQKRVLDVVPLVQALERTGANYRMTLIGGAPDGAIERTLRERLAPQLVTGKVRLPGTLNRAQVMQQLRAHDVCVLFSEFEGFPVSLVEAMSAGCIPAVAAALSGIPELVTHGENGLIFQDRNYDRWAEALVSLRRHRDRAEAMALRAQQTISDRYTVESMADRFEALFSSVLEGIDERSWSRPPSLTWHNALDDVLIPPSLYGKPLD